MILTQAQIDELKKLLYSCLDTLYQNEKQLIDLGGIEQAISFRFGIYVHEAIKQVSWLNGFNLDMEYNKHGIDSKRVEGLGVRPDLILHTRQIDDNNVMIIEFKGYWNGNGESDYQKLRSFTNQTGDYKYGLGVFIKFGEERFNCKCKLFFDYTPINRIDPD